MEGVKLRIRVIFMTAAVLGLMLAAGGKLMSMQAGEDTKAPEEKERTSIEYKLVPAARGGIFDRYGRPLVTNRMGLNLTVDESVLLKAENPAAEVWKLVAAAEESGVTIRDSLPVTSPPYAYIPVTGTAQADFDHFLQKKGIAPADVDSLMDGLAADYALPHDMPLTMKRKVTGVFYELELRRLFTRVAPYRYIAPYIFAEDIGVELAGQVKEQGFAGCVVEAVSTREYATDYAAHLLGRIGQIPEEEIGSYTAEMGYTLSDIVGLDGAEKAFEQWLRGTPGRQAVEQTDAGRIHNVFYSTEPEPGKNVYLTIDIRFQEQVERILSEGIAELQATGEELKGKEAEAGAVAVIDVRNGEIMALANYPSYDLKTFREDFDALLHDPLNPLYNRAIAGLYEPGSTFKMVTAAAGMENGFISPKTQIFDHGKYTVYPDYQPRCSIYPGSHGNINVGGALKVSCNYFFYDVGYHVGISEIKKWANNFGLGLPTGVELPSARAGYVAGPETSALQNQQWQPGLTLAAAIGQANHQLTPLSMANYVSVIANGGTVNRAHLMREAKSSDHTQTYSIDTGGELRQSGLSESTIGALQNGMRMAASESGGTAYTVFHDFPYSVAAKTGSVQTGDSPSDGVFVAYAPYDNPEIAVCVVVEKGGAGSRVAPIARRVFETWFALQEDMAVTGDENSLQK
ncbi:MAG: hypothetical protein LBR85_00795 [Oscillospiraceae bacterium]|jgi:penicillin-binding protein 2|nr:hypothetical protein [Oscillospiraceae bacterium]